MIYLLASVQMVVAEFALAGDIPDCHMILGVALSESSTNALYDSDEALTRFHQHHLMVPMQ